MHEETPEKVNKWLQIKKPVRARSQLSSEEMISFAARLNAELLAEVEALPAVMGVRLTENYDIMNRHGDYNVNKDGILGGSFAIVRREEDRRTADKGPSCSKDRFSSKYWDTWSKDYVLLEDMSRRELEEKKERDRILGARKQPAPPNPKLRKVTPLERSHMKGNTIGAPKDYTSPYFDFHQVGNRNDMLKMYTTSLGREVPKALFQSALLNAHANVDPDACGRRALKGGAINSGPARPPAPTGLTSKCDMPPVDRAKGSPKMTGFSASGRNSMMGRVAAPGGGVVEDYKVPSNAIGFARAARSSELQGKPADGPGPGGYEVPRIFEGKNDPKPRDLSYSLLVLQNSKDYRSVEEEDLAKLVGFGFGCSRQEHVLYGMCLDGQCGRRSDVEVSMLKTKQFKRLGAPSAAVLNQLLYCQDTTPRVPKPKPKLIAGAEVSVGDRSMDTPPSPSSLSPPGMQSPHGKDMGKGTGKGKGEGDSGGPMRSGEQAEMLEQDRLRRRQERQKVLDSARWKEERRRWTETLVPPPGEELPPLHMAAHRGDCEAIQRMARLKDDVNERQGELNDTPLIVAARKGHLRAVNALVDNFWGIIDVDARNGEGDTALHVAARGARDEVVKALCEADADSQLRNTEGKRPIDVTKKHSIKSSLSIQSDYESLNGELRQLKRQRQMLEARAAAAAAAAAAGEMDGAGAGPLPRLLDSRAESRAGSSRGTSRGSERSRIMELGGSDKRWDEAAESIKVNRSMFAMSATPSTLPDPKQNSYIVGYYPPEPVKKNK